MCLKYQLNEIESFVRLLLLDIIFDLNTPHQQEFNETFVQKKTITIIKCNILCKRTDHRKDAQRKLYLMRLYIMIVIKLITR